MANKEQRRRKQRERRRRQEEAKEKGGRPRETPRWAGLNPWEPVNMGLFNVGPIFPESVTREERIAVLQTIGTQAEETFQREFPQVTGWFHQYDALYLLAYCVVYFLTHPKGVDPEVTGHLDFYPHYLEILQAFSLMQDRSSSSASLGPGREELRKSMGAIGDAIGLRWLRNRAGLTNDEFHQQFVLQRMRTQTAGVRNWAYPRYMYEVVRSLADTVRSDFIKLYGADPVRLTETLVDLSKIAEARMNQHRGRVSHFVRQSSVQQVAAAYLDSFPEVIGFDTDRLYELAGRHLDSFKFKLIEHSNLRLADSLTFTLDDIAVAYGQGADRQALEYLFDRLAIKFGELRDQDKEHVILDNPVWNKPFIKIDHETYFSSVISLMPHYTLGLLENLVSADSQLAERYRQRKAGYLENELEELFRKSFPAGKIYRGSTWDDGAGGNGENDLTAVVGSVAIIAEAKSGVVSPPASRGAPERFRRTVRELIEEPSEQAHRFIKVLRSSQGPQSFPTRNGSVNTIDASGIRFYVPLTVTLEQFGSVSNLRDLVESGISSRKLPELAPVISLTDLMVIFEILDLQSERVHYLARRREINSHVVWFGDELDILAFYLQNGFNIGETEFSGEGVLGLLMYSKTLDPYFGGKEAGVRVPKPELALTEWWKNLLKRLDLGRIEPWLEAAILLLNVTFKDQQKLERRVQKLVGRFGSRKLKAPHNWVYLIAGPPQRRFFLAFYPYSDTDHETRNSVISEILDSPEAKASRGAVCIGIDLEQARLPYSVAALVPSPNLFEELQ